MNLKKHNFFKKKKENAALFRIIYWDNGIGEIYACDVYDLRGLLFTDFSCILD